MHGLAGREMGICFLGALGIVMSITYGLMDLNRWVIFFVWVLRDTKRVYNYIAE